MIHDRDADGPLQDPRLVGAVDAPVPTPHAPDDQALNELFFRLRRYSEVVGCNPFKRNATGGSDAETIRRRLMGGQSRAGFEEFAQGIAVFRAVQSVVSANAARMRKQTNDASR